MTAGEFLDSITAEEWTKLQARHDVMPFDHTEKMLGFIALCIARYLGTKGDIEKMCCPWLEQD